MTSSPMVMEQVGQVNPVVVSTGDAAVEGMTIWTSEKAYLCRIVLPGVWKSPSNLEIEIKEDGTMIVRATIALGEVQISFRLPGPVDPRLVHPMSMPDGVLKVVVFKPNISKPAALTTGIVEQRGSSSRSDQWLEVRITTGGKCGTITDPSSTK